MDKKQKIAIIVLPILAIAILAGGMSITGKSNSAAASAYIDGVYEGEGQGFAGPIKVKVKVEGGKIASIDLVEIGDTPGIGDKGAEEVISRIIENQSADVDASTGATMSSNGVMEAVKNALAGASGEITLVDGEYEGEGAGFAGPIKVKVKVEGEKIVSIDLVEIGDTPGIGDKGAEEVIGRIIENQSADVEVSTGATMSSNGVMEAVRNALSGGSGEATAGGEAEAALDITALADGAYEGTAKGFNGDIKVSVEVKDGKIEKVNILENSETEGLGDKALKNLAEAMVQEQKIDVDAETGATYSSKGIKEAVTNALNSASAAKEEAAEKEVASEFKDGTYVGKGKSFHDGDMELEVTIEGGKITKVDIIKMNETEGLGDEAVKKIATQAVEKQSAELDSVSGATVSSTGAITAIKDALSQAQ